MTRKKPTSTKPGNRAIGYIRVSTSEQAFEGVSLDAQEARVRAAAVARDVELVDIITDAGESGNDLERPGMKVLLERVTAGEVDWVIITKLDRLSRKVRDVVSIVDLLCESGAELFSLHESFDTKTPHGRFCLHLFAALAEMERDVIVERTKEALQHKRRKGEVVGNVPFGWTAQGGKLVMHADEQEIVRQVRAWDAAGQSLSMIADSLNAHGFRNRLGGPWQKQGVHRILSANRA